MYSKEFILESPRLGNTPIYISIASVVLAVVALGLGVYSGWKQESLLKTNSDAVVNKLSSINQNLEAGRKGTNDILERLATDIKSSSRQITEYV